MTETLSELLRLQELDEKIMKGEKRLEVIPREILKLEKALESEKTRQREVQEQLKKTKVKRQEVEGKIEHLELTLRKYQNQVLEVKTNEGYTALLHEIEGVKGNIREYEEDVLELMESVEGLEAELAKVQLELKQAEENHLEMTQSLINEKALIETDIEDVRHTRGVLSGQLEINTLARYERVRSAIPELPIAQVVNGGFCGGCFAQITLQRQAEIRKSEELMSCESCGRIVYYTNDKKSN